MMSEQSETGEPLEPEPGLTHEAKFYIALIVGLLPFLMLWDFMTVDETPTEITVRPHWLIGVFYVLVLSYATFQLFRHFRTEEPALIPAMEKQFGTLMFVIAVIMIHFCFEMVSVDPQKFTVYHPILALLVDPDHYYSDLDQIELRQQGNGKSTLLVWRKGNAVGESTDCNALLRRVLPRLSVAAKAAGVKVVGF